MGRGRSWSWPPAAGLSEGAGCRVGEARARGLLLRCCYGFEEKTEEGLRGRRRLRPDRRMDGSKGLGWLGAENQEGGRLRVWIWEDPEVGGE